MSVVKALVNGVWHSEIELTPNLQASFQANADRFRHWVTADGSSSFPAEAGRYRLYVSYACPWAHRTVLYRRLKGLEDVIGLSVLHPRWAGPEGWTFGDTAFSTRDHAGGRRALHEVYTDAATDYSGRVTVPVLWDETRQTIVSNESADIIRMLNAAFDGVGGDPSVDFHPVELRAAIDAMNDLILPNVCVGVYKVGFAASQAAHDAAVERLFDTLDRLEALLSDGRCYLLGDRITESDWHLFATLCRFDAVYHGALKCNLYRLVDYPALTDYTRRLHDMPGVAETVRTDHVKLHYYDDIPALRRPIVPAGPREDYRRRGSRAGAAPPSPAVQKKGSDSFSPSPDDAASC